MTKDIDIVDFSGGGAESIDDWMPDKILQNAVAEALGLEVSKITKSEVRVR